ncbi:MAG: NAD(P)H-dependent oxidoreductase subunit E [bacterium]
MDHNKRFYNKRFINKIIQKYGSSDSLISILQDIQSEFNYLPEEAIRYVAKGLDLPLIQVYSVASFFKAFSLEPRGKHTIHMCLGTACHVRGAPAVLNELERELGIKSGETTDDMQFTLETVNCLGACALGPVVVVDGKYYGQMTAGKVKKMLANLKESTEAEEYEEEYKKIKVAN